MNKKIQDLNNYVKMEVQPTKLEHLDKRELMESIKEKMMEMREEKQFGFIQCQRKKNQGTVTMLEDTGRTKMFVRKYSMRICRVGFRPQI